MKAMLRSWFAACARAICLTAAVIVLPAGAAFSQDAIVPDDFATIGAAVQGATDQNGNAVIEIFVRAGTYNENLLIRRSDLRIEGENRATTIIRGTGPASTIRVENTFGVWIRHVTVTSSGVLGHGVDLSRAHGGRIEDCVIGGNLNGIAMRRATGNTVIDCEVLDNRSTGIKVNAESHGAILSVNMIFRNGNHGIDAIFSDGVTISGNVSEENGDNGCRFGGGTACNVVSNRFDRNGGRGIFTGRAARNFILNNVCNANLSDGIRIRETSQYLISGNAFTNNMEFGIRRRDWDEDDWDAGTGGVQDPPGANDVTGNVQGGVRSDT
jgi:parallel beta-helix repeat protein